MKTLRYLFSFIQQVKAEIQPLSDFVRIFNFRAECNNQMKELVPAFFKTAIR